MTPKVSLKKKFQLKSIAPMSNTNPANSPASILKANIKKKAETKDTPKPIQTQGNDSNQVELVNVKVNSASIIADDNQSISQLDELKELAESWKTKALRFAADNQNILKQHELDNQQVIKRTKKTILTLIMPFLTSMNLAFAMMPKSLDTNVNKYIDGLKSQLDKLTNDLKNAQVELIIPTKGEEFNPTTMTSLNSSEDEELTVKQVVGLGVRIDGQLIQAATVML